ncbi:DNRLRE domain-containing protein, partial [bacterium]|nr:DNRLRE domain-containing protein [bacterium]
ASIGNCASKNLIQYKATLKTNNKIISPELYNLKIVFNDEFDYLSSSEIKNKDTFILGKESNIISFTSTSFGNNLLESSFSENIFNWRAILDSSDTSSYISNISLNYSIPQVAELILKNNYPVFFQFDMSSLPKNAKILDAKLRFYVASKNNSGNISLSLLTSDWGIGNSIQPTYSATSFVDRMVNLTGWQEFDLTDVTSLVEGYNRRIWDHFSNYGNFGIRLSTTTGDFRIYSSSNSNLKPRLSLKYEVSGNREYSTYTGDLSSDNVNDIYYYDLTKDFWIYQDKIEYDGDGSYIDLPHYISKPSDIIGIWDYDLENDEPILDGKNYSNYLDSLTDIKGGVESNLEWDENLDF